jgi:hypothetical protein
MITFAEVEKLGRGQVPVVQDAPGGIAVRMSSSSPNA